MNCSIFRKNHGALVDDVLDDHEVVAMQCHIAECTACAAHDTRVRRALLLFRNLPLIEPSRGFAERLSIRLGQERRRAARDAALRPTVATRGPGLGVFAAAAASVAAVAFLAATRMTRAETPLALPPVVATRVAEPAPAVDQGASPVSSPVMLASVAAGMPIWPTALLVDEAPLHFASSEFQFTSYGR